MAHKIFHNHPRAVGGGFDQGAVDFFAGGQGHPHDQARQVVIRQHAAVAVPPVQRQQAAFAGLQRFGQLGEVNVQIFALPVGFLL